MIPVKSIELVVLLDGAELCFFTLLRVVAVDIDT